MNEVIAVHLKFCGKTHLEDYLRYIGKAHRNSSQFEYTDPWLSYREAFAFDSAYPNIFVESHAHSLALANQNP